MHIDTRELDQAAPFGLELVNARGEKVWRGSIQPHQNQLVVAIPARLNAGKYWVRLFDASTPPVAVREYGLELK